MGLCDLTRGEMSSNGTPEERVKEAEDARKVLRRRVARESRAARPRDRVESGPCAPGGRDDSALPAAGRRAAVLAGSPPRSCGVSGDAARGVFNAKLRRYEAEGEPWQPEWICFYFINDAAPPSFVVDVSDYYDIKRQALACYRSQFTRATGPAETRLNSPSFNQLIESRDAQFGALAGVAVRRRDHRERARGARTDC